LRDTGGAVDLAAEVMVARLLVGNRRQFSPCGSRQ
jgi:hypothetical protein